MEPKYEPIVTDLSRSDGNRIADMNPPRTPKRKRKTDPPNQLVFFTTVRMSLPEEGPKYYSELALYSLGRLRWDTQELSLEDYLRMEFLLHVLSGDRRLEDIKDTRKRILCGYLSLALLYAPRSFQPTREFIELNFLFQMMFAKFGITETLSERAHRARCSPWSSRYFLWLSIVTESENAQPERGIRYSSYTKGYHDGSTLRPTPPENEQVLDREAYTRTLRNPISLEIWDPEEFRRNL